MRVGERIRELRKAHGISQRELARRLNLSHTAIGEYERGGSGVDADFLREIGEAIGVPVSAFYEAEMLENISTAALMAIIEQRVNALQAAQKTTATDLQEPGDSVSHTRQVWQADAFRAPRVLAGAVS